MHPILFAGLAVAGVPVLLHLLLRQQPKRLPFPALRFLKVRARTSQRRVKLRHILLLALRVLLLALFCAALFQPVVPSPRGGLGGVNLAAGKPVAAVLVIDTSPSMGYLFEKRTRLEDAVRRAKEFVDALPASSRVAVLTTAEPAGTWELSPADAQRRLASLTRPDGGGVPLSSVLRAAYPLFQSADVEGGSLAGEPLPKLVALFTDRAANSFAADQAEELKRAADAVPNGPVAHLLFDVGVDSPADVAVLSIAADPVAAPAGKPVTVTASVRAVGPEVPAATVIYAATDGSPPLQQEVRLPAGTPGPVAFTLTGLKPGVHQAEVRLTTPDNLGPADVPGFDNVRFVTFRVGGTRTLLTITDDPAAVRYWQLAHRAKGDFECEVVTPDKVPPLANYQGVCLLGVRDPSPLWAKLKQYVERGGKVLIAPTGIAHVDPSKYTVAASDGLTPAGLVDVRDLTTEPPPPADKPDAPDLRAGAILALTETATGHPLLAPIRQLQLKGNTDFLRRPPRAWRFWRTTPVEPGAVVVRYDDAADPTRQDPAILEKSFPNGGRTLLLTTRLDQPGDVDSERWNDYWQTDGTSWYLYFPNLLARYLAGEGIEANYQFTTGQAVTLPAGSAADARALAFEGPNVTGSDSLQVAAGEIRVSPRQTLTAGNYRVKSADGKTDEGFSLNPPTDEANLAKVPAEAFAPLKAVLIPVDKSLDLSELIETTGGSLPLFPLLCDPGVRGVRRRVGAGESLLPAGGDELICVALARVVFGFKPGSRGVFSPRSRGSPSWPARSPLTLLITAIGRN